MVSAARGHTTHFIRRVESAAVNPAVRQLAITCISKDIPVAELADLFGVSRATVYNWLMGTTVPRSKQLEAMPKITARLNKRK
jgi:transposase-like protein